jgi:hypothetical protein
MNGLADCYLQTAEEQVPIDASILTWIKPPRILKNLDMNQYDHAGGLLD